MGDAMAGLGRRVTIRRQRPVTKQNVDRQILRIEAEKKRTAAAEVSLKKEFGRLIPEQIYEYGRSKFRARLDGRLEKI